MPTAIRTMIASTFIFYLAAFGCIPCFAQSEAILHFFPKQTGSSAPALYRPAGALVENEAGVLFGTTQFGKNGAGNAFELIPPAGGVGKWTYKLIHAFRGSGDGYLPVGSLAMDSSGALYGITMFGGANDLGAVFKISPSGPGWKEEIIHSFSGGADGLCPVAGVVLDTAGNVYGTTLGPVSYVTGCSLAADMVNGGTVFELSPPPKPKAQWTETILHSFPYCSLIQPCSDGSNADDKLIFDSQGNLYGTTLEGGTNGYGAVFEISKTSTGCTGSSQNGWCETALASFGGLNGYQPAGLVFDNSGNLYGTTYTTTGTINEYHAVLFELPPANANWTPQILADFCSASETCPNGPMDASGLVYYFNAATGSGVLYGTASEGSTVGQSSCGSVFEYTTASATLTTLYSFQGGSKDGCAPYDSVIRDPNSGVLFGTTQSGGPGGYVGNPESGLGTVFQVTP